MEIQSLFNTFYSNFINFHKNKRFTDPYCSFTATHKQNLKKCAFRITKDNRKGCVFSIDLERVNCFDFIKKKIKLLYNDNWQLVYDFLANFDLF